MTEAMEASPSDMDPLSSLREEVKEPGEAALASLKRLGIVALALGPARTLTELVPFIQEQCEQWPTDALLVVANQLGDFFEMVGGAEHVPVLLPVLEKLAAEENDQVREAAVQSLIKLAPLSFEPDGFFMPLIGRLANAEWYSTRVSACKLLAPVYPLLSSESQEECRTLYVTFAGDDSEVIKTAAAQNLGPYAVALQQELFDVEAIPLLLAFAKDPKEAIRSQALKACTFLCEKLSAEMLETHLIPILVLFHCDKIWRIRRQFCKVCPSFARFIPNAVPKIMTWFMTYLTDKEGAVRIEAVTVLPELIREAKPELPPLVASLETAATDQVGVRVAVAHSLVAVATQVGDRFTSNISRLLLKLSGDEALEVRSELPVLIDDLMLLLGPEDEVWIPLVTNLLADSLWRVRIALVEKFVTLAKCPLVKAQLHIFVARGLEDPVYAVREMCGLQITQIYLQFGEAWCVEHVLPTLTILARKENYLLRLTALSVITKCAPSCTSAATSGGLLSLVEGGAVDAVANVRIATTHAVRAMLEKAEGDTRNKLFAILNQLQRDTDCDVSHFALEAYRFAVVRQLASSRAVSSAPS